jgi:hypothetical protein
MPCPVPHLAEDHDLRERLEYAQFRAMDQPHHASVDHAYEEALIRLRLILEDGCADCVRETVRTLHRACGWPLHRGICQFLVEWRLAELKRVH